MFPFVRRFFAIVYEFYNSPFAERSVFISEKPPDLQPQLNYMLIHTSSFKVSETSGSLTAQGQASMLDGETHPIQAPVIFDESPKKCVLLRCSDGALLLYDCSAPYVSG